MAENPLMSRPGAVVIDANFPIALAEELSQTYTTRLLTFDRRLLNQAARHAPGVSVHLLP